MSENIENSYSEDSPFSDDIELFDELFNEEYKEGGSDLKNECSPNTDLDKAIPSEGEEREEETFRKISEDTTPKEEIRNIWR